MRIGINLLWVRVGIVGGTESVIRSLINGFGQYDRANEYILFTAKDNEESFRSYTQYPNITIAVCNVNCSSPARRILWENRNFDKVAAGKNIDLMFIPVYSKPRTYGSKIPYVSVIHDLQAFHYPQYFSPIKRIFLKYAWKHTCKTSAWVVTISDFCKEDLIAHYPFVKDKVSTVYNPIVSNESDYDFGKIAEKYDIEKEAYFYCVSSMLPHKNLGTLLKVMMSLKNRKNKIGKELPKLVISGVGGNKEQLLHTVREYQIEEQIVLTGFISNEERDCFYENCRLFLFPSVFEGFGMPPIEAMRKGKGVVMTKESCLKEVTEGKAVYVEQPMNIEEWVEKIEYAMGVQPKEEEFPQYKLEQIVKEYLKVFQKPM